MPLADSVPLLTRRLSATAAAVVFVAVTSAAVAEQDTGAFSSSPIGEWKPEHYLVAAFCGLGLVIILLEFVLFFRARDRVSATDIMRSFSTTLILIGVVALLGVGYNERQVQPAIALFGTLLGYLMGRGEAVGTPRTDAQTRPDERTR